MPKATKGGGYTIRTDSLPEHYPTHLADPRFWEALGRAVATFGFLEEALAKAIFALTATSPVPEGKDEFEAVQEWIASLELTISDTLGQLIIRYEKALKAHPEQNVIGIETLVDDLRSAASIRNAVCHGSWGPPDQSGASLPFFIDRKLRKLETRFDIEKLDRLRAGTLELTCSVINSVTHMGYQFPSSAGPGAVVY